MAEEERWVEAISKLIELTQEGELEWHTIDRNDHLSPAQHTEADLEIAFGTHYRGRTLRLYQEARRHEISGGTVAGSTGPPTWSKTITLDIVDQQGQQLWEFPQSDALADLLEAVRYQVADVDQFIDEILEEEAN